jgi:hypothetical protein
MRLGGWKRLWIVISLILLLLFGFFGFILQSKPNRVEDISIIQKLTKDAVIKAEIAGLGIVEFPDETDQKEIDRIVESNFDKSTKEQIPIIAKKLIDDRNRKQAKEAREANDRIRSANWEIILYAFLGWLGTIFALYALAWSTGWIYKGFRSK